ncbi:hypothetical protein KCP78_12965 [Salmonella enterica subsp. enterica]|nr:hypothetical protein KCP78_12965 [Salmonella enterica subsp. enterica]
MQFLSLVVAAKWRQRVGLAATKPAIKAGFVQKTSCGLTTFSGCGGAEEIRSVLMRRTNVS